MKYSQWIGTAAAIMLVIACFFPWTWYPDLNRNFTGFFSEDNMYGKPGWTFIVLSIPAVVFFLTPRVWAKRWNLLICALIVSYAIKTYILFTGCYRGLCPDKKMGLWIMMAASLIMLVMAIFPDLKVAEEKNPEKKP